MQIRSTIMDSANNVKHNIVDSGKSIMGGGQPD